MVAAQKQQLRPDKNNILDRSVCHYLGAKLKIIIHFTPFESFYHCNCMRLNNF
jgi:hypothetical protein